MKMKKLFLIIISFLFFSSFGYAYNNSSVISWICWWNNCEYTETFDLWDKSFKWVVEAKLSIFWNFETILWENKYININLNWENLFFRVKTNTNSNNLSFKWTRLIDLDNLSEIKISTIWTNDLTHYWFKLTLNYDTKIISNLNNWNNKEIFSRDFLYMFYSYEIGITILVMIIVFLYKLMDIKGFNLYSKNLFFWWKK